MTAKIIEFPNLHRRRLVTKNARAFIGYSAKGLNNALNALLRQQRAKLERRGLPASYIDTEIDTIRTEIIREIGQRRGTGRVVL